ncbi:MAG: putative Ig domain-containing protein [Candidatus Scalindua sp.]|nr:putative Ig domain-containing protein [Candidatus Scalindua sp.]
MGKRTMGFKRFLFNQLALVLLLPLFSFLIIAVEAKAQQCTITDPPVFGLTIITHGYQLGGDYWPGTGNKGLPKWVDEMAVAIANRYGGIDKIPIYTMNITKDSDDVITASFPSPYDLEFFRTAGGAIIKVNWASLSCGDPLTCPDITITTIIADAISKYLRTNLSGDWLKVPIHLIGHSRGASVNSRLAYDLGSSGIWVDHFTSLDPQPLTSIGDWVVKAYNNVLFADNNYRRTGLLPWGEPVNGTYQRLLNDVVMDEGYYCNQLGNPFATAHSQIHAYYHGTIYYDTCVDSTSVQSNWYSPYYYPNFKTGYYFSRIGKGDRYSSDNSGDGNSNNPIDGLHYRLSRSTTNNRETLSAIYPAWPNATFKPFDNKIDYNLEVGKPVDFAYYYQDADFTDTTNNTLTITFSLDNDTNPFNDTGNNCYKEIGSHPGNAKRNSISDRIVFNWTPTNNETGSHYVQIKATDNNGHERFDYLLKPINIRSVNQPESDLVIENFSIIPNSGEPGTPATVNFTIHNIDSGPAYSSRTNIRLSSSSSDVTTGDTLLRSIETPRIEAGATYDISESVTISDVDTSGTYYVWVILDVNNEANQGSNTSNDKTNRPFIVTVPPPPSKIGDYVQVYNTGTDGLRVRSPNACDSPLIGQNRFDLDTGKVIDGPQTCNLSGNDYQMWKIQWDDCLIGWSAETWLKKISSATISCDATPTITTSSPLPDGGVGYAYGWTLQAISGTTPYSWSIVSGSLPPDLNLDSSTGTISGTPTTSGTYDFRVRVTGNDGLFSEKDISLTINSTSTTTYTLNVSATNGTVTKTPDLASYASGSQVTLTPVPNAGYQFNGWSGDASGSADLLTITMDSNKNITASFTTTSTQTGSIRVSIVPPEASDAGAQWKLTTESTWRNSGTIKNNVLFGTYQVEFKTISGWITPLDKEVTISVVNPDIWINSDPYIQPGIVNAPTNLQAIATSSNEITLTWEDNSSNEEAFILEWDIGATGSYSRRYVLGPNTTSWIDDGYVGLPYYGGLKPGTTYCYRLQTYASALGYSGFSNEACATTLNVDSTGPIVSNPTPSKPTITEGDNSIIISATIDDSTTGNSNIAAAEFYTGNSDPGNGNGLSMSPADGSFNSTNENVQANIDTSTWTAANSPYTINVRGQDAEGNWGNIQSISITVTFPPPTAGTPSSITVPSTDSDGTYTVSWGASSTSGVTYVLEEATNPGFTGSLTAYSGTGTIASRTGRSNGVTYYYRVKATKSGYNESAWKSGSSGCTVTLPTPTTNLDVIIDFGVSYGIWSWMNNSTWVQLHGISPETITTGDIDGGGKDDVIIDFGAPYGIWSWMNNSIWVQLHGTSPQTITTGDIDGGGKDDIIIDFGAPYGIWIRMNNSTWVQLHGTSPETITTGDIDGGGKDDVIIDFGVLYGIWSWMNNSIWVQLHGLSPETITTGDIDGGGKDDVIIDFGVLYGIWCWMNNSTWVQLHGTSPETITTGEIDGN